MRATIHALSQMDPAALTIQQICREAEVSAPTLYYHFGNKDGLIAAAKRAGVPFTSVRSPGRAQLKRALHRLAEHLQRGRRPSQ